MYKALYIKKYRPLSIYFIGKLYKEPAGNILLNIVPQIHNTQKSIVRGKMFVTNA